MKPGHSIPVTRPVTICRTWLLYRPCCRPMSTRRGSQIFLTSQDLAPMLRCGEPFKVFPHAPCKNGRCIWESYFTIWLLAISKTSAPSHERTFADVIHRRFPLLIISACLPIFFSLLRDGASLPRHSHHLSSISPS